MRALIATLVALLCLVAAGRAGAHGTRSVTILVDEITPGRAVVNVRALDPEDEVTVTFEPACAPDPGLVPAASGHARGADSSPVVGFSCDATIAGRTLIVMGLGPVVPEAIVAVTFADGRTTSAVVHSDDPRAPLPASGSFAGVAGDHVRLGLEHILAGADHLLFLALLVLALRDTKKVLLAETAFTVSHSLSFSATALGLVRVSPAAAEACIAASLLLVAADVGRRKEPASTREGVFTALVFGLVHGLGFAGGLREIGIPEEHIGAALVGFAGGVEVGQILFLALFLGLVALVRKRPSFAAWERGAAALSGGVALYWFCQRALVCLLA